jgi:hypothetical protein
MNELDIIRLIKIEEDEMSGECSTNGGEEEYIQDF